MYVFDSVQNFVIVGPDPHQVVDHLDPDHAPVLDQGQDLGPGLEVKVETT